MKDSAGDHVYCDDKDYRNVRRCLAELAQVRVLDEKEFTLDWSVRLPYFFLDK